MGRLGEHSVDQTLTTKAAASNDGTNKLDASPLHTQMDQRFEAAQREMQQMEQAAARQVEQQAAASSSGHMAELQQGRSGPCGYRWHSRMERTGPGGWEAGRVCGCVGGVGGLALSGGAGRLVGGNAHLRLHCTA